MQSQTLQQTHGHSFDAAGMLKKQMDKKRGKKHYAGEQFALLIEKEKLKEPEGN